MKLSVVIVIFATISLSTALYHTVATTHNICIKHNCHKLAYCIPLQYGFRCVCKPGFVGNGQFCTRFPVCRNNPCRPGSSCLPGIFGGFRCVCNFGFYRVGRQCVSSLSCQFRCGRPYNPLFPCQCDAQCQTLGLCCQDFSARCPNIVPLTPVVQKPVFVPVHQQPTYVAQVHKKPTYAPPKPHKPTYHHPTQAPAGYPSHPSANQGGTGTFVPAPFNGGQQAQLAQGTQTQFAQAGQGTEFAQTGLGTEFGQLGSQTQFGQTGAQETQFAGTQTGFGTFPGGTQTGFEQSQAAIVV